MNSVNWQSIFDQVPNLRGLDPADFKLTALPGLTNYNYRLRNQQHDWVLRLPRAETNPQINRIAEACNQSLAAGLGIAPEAIWRDPSGISLTPSLLPCRVLTSADFAGASTLGAIGELLRRLHGSKLKFQGMVAIDERIAHYFNLLPSAEQQRRTVAWREVQCILSRLVNDDLTEDMAAVPSHNDLVLENLLIDQQQLWMIDWEYSSMASPYWDLATLCNAANLNQPQSAELLRRYCQNEVRMQESRLQDYRILLRFLSDCWMTAFYAD